MCTVVILRRLNHPWPLALLANRDEMSTRPSQAPGRHWSDRPQIVAGFDQLAGGTWMGLNDDGVVACILNRRHSLGPARGFRSRGELPLEALDHADAQTAAIALAALAPTSYRPFNLLIADSRKAFWLSSDGARMAMAAIAEGLSMLSAADLNDTDSSLRQRHYLPKFQAATPPAPDDGDWADWERLAASPDVAPGGQASDAMAFATDAGFGTVSSSLLALPAATDPVRRPVWRYAEANSGLDRYQDVDLSVT